MPLIPDTCGSPVDMARLGWTVPKGSMEQIAVARDLSEPQVPDERQP